MRSWCSEESELPSPDVGPERLRASGQSLKEKDYEVAVATLESVAGGPGWQPPKMKTGVRVKESSLRPFKVKSKKIFIHIPKEVKYHKAGPIFGAAAREGFAVRYDTAAPFLGPPGGPSFGSVFVAKLLNAALDAVPQSLFFFCLVAAWVKSRAERPSVSGVNRQLHVQIGCKLGIRNRKDELTKQAKRNKLQIKPEGN